MPELKLHSNPEAQTKKSFDELIKYIRVRSEDGARFVEFDFAIGDPSLFVELVMPPEAFKHFCELNKVVHMTKEQMVEVDSELEKWRYGEDTLMSRNQNRT